MEPRNRLQGMNSASLCSLAGRYGNPIPSRFLVPIDCLKISDQDSGSAIGLKRKCLLLCLRNKKQMQKNARNFAVKFPFRDHTDPFAKSVMFEKRYPATFRGWNIFPRIFPSFEMINQLKLYHIIFPFLITNFASKANNFPCLLRSWKHLVYFNHKGLTYI